MASVNDFKGKWALVTGASAGIGVALARQGAKLILTARRKAKVCILVDIPDGAFGPSSKALTEAA